MSRLFCYVLVIISNLSVSFSATGEPLLLPAEGTIRHDYYAFLEAKGGFQTPSNFFRSRLLSSSTAQQLKARFESAQESFFTQKKSVALTKYISVFSLFDESDWSEHHREIFFFVALRIAQLTRGNEQQVWLRRAANYFPGMSANPEVFPPPFLAAYAAAQTERESKIVKVTHFTPDFRFISVNGVLTDLQESETVEFPTEESRVTLYSDTFQPVSRVMTASELSNWQPSKKSLLQGSCKKPQLHLRHKPASIYGFYHLNCIKSLYGSGPLSFSDKNLKPLPPQPPLDVALSQISAEVKSPKQWWQNKWVWWSLAAAGTAYLIYDHNQRSGSSKQTPTTTYKD